MKKIGIDIKILAEKRTGIGNYLESILKKLPENNFEFYCFSHKKINLDLKKKNFYFIHSNFKSSIGRQIWSQTILPYLLIKNKIDLFWSPAHRIPFLISKKIKTVVTIHDLVWFFYGNTMRKFSFWLDKMLMPYAIKTADLIISVSKNTKNDILNIFKVKKNKVIVSYLGSKTFRQPNNIKKKSTYYNCILLVATNDPRKNIYKTIDAYSRLNDKLKLKHNLVIVGSRGWNRKNISTYITNFKLKKFVKHLGYVNEYNLGLLYSNCKCLILASKFEGFGLPLVEAMSFDKPQITSKNSSMLEISKSTALFVNPNSVYDINQKLNLILNNKSIYKNLSHNCQIKKKFFSWEKTASITIKIFEQLLKN